MARTKGTLSLSSNIEPSMNAPLDARLVVNTVADLTASGSFPYFYEGMVVSCKENHKLYQLIGNDPTASANWSEVGSGGGGGGGSSTDYSTTEQEIGTWIDGSTVYQIVSSTPNVPSDLVDLIPAYTSEADSKITWSSWDGTYPAKNLFDKDNTTRWIASSDDGWVTYDLGEAVVADAWRFASTNDAYERSSTVYLLASNDDTNFTQLDTRSRTDYPTKGQLYTFSFTNTTAYRYYRIRCKGTSWCGGAEFTVLRSTVKYIKREQLANGYYLLQYTKTT